MKFKTQPDDIHVWTEGETDQLVAAIEAGRDGLKALLGLATTIKDHLLDMQIRLVAAEAWIEQHKKEAAAFKAQSQQPTQLIDRELFKPTTIQAPLPIENGPNVVHYRKWSELQHKVITVSEPDLGGEA